MATKLTAKQENFCVAYLEKQNAPDAYRVAYITEKMSVAAIKAESYKVLAMPKIKARIDELRAPAVKAAKITLESHLAELEKLRNKAETATDYGAAIRAEVARGKAAGLYVDKIDLNLTGSLAERLARARQKIS
jgi:hypothetical protein